MIPSGTRIWIVAGVTDLRRGFVGLRAQGQTAIEENPFPAQKCLVEVPYQHDAGLRQLQLRVKNRSAIWGYG
jgi:hypothetical protein